MKIKLTNYDGTNFLKTQSDIDEYLSLAFESNDPKLITRALGNVVKTQNISATARATGLNRAGLYRSFSINKGGDPRLSTLTKIMDSFGYRLSLTPKTARRHQTET
jgi:probable addiction module antidote protein